MKKVWFAVSITLMMIIAGFLSGKNSFSELEVSSFKISGVIKSLHVSDPNHSDLILVSENGAAKTLSLSPSATVVLEGKPVSLGELKTGDVVDADCEFDAATKQTFARRVDIIVRAALDQMAQDPPSAKDPEFE